MAIGNPCIYCFILFVPFRAFLAKKTGIFRLYFLLGKRYHSYFSDPLPLQLRPSERAYPKRRRRPSHPPSDSYRRCSRAPILTAEDTQIVRASSTEGTSARHLKKSVAPRRTRHARPLASQGHTSLGRTIGEHRTDHASSYVSLYFFSS